MSAPSHAVVTVTYNPDLGVLRRQLAGLAGATAILLVDNASAAPVVEGLRALASETGAALVANARNEGLAAGLNTGAAAALDRAPGCEYLVFLDQDTEPGAGAVGRLVEAAAALRAADARIGLVGPLMVDATTGLSHGVHVVRGWRWTRIFPAAGQDGAVPCASVNGSGMVVPVEVFRALGGFEESFFIDHVDSEYSFRASYAGYGLATLPGIRFVHRMGERTLRFWLGRWRAWPYRPPARHYYLFRNAVALMRRRSTPAVWKAWAPAKMVLTACVHAIAGPDRTGQLGAMLSGIRAGLGGREAPRHP